MFAERDGGDWQIRHSPFLLGPKRLYGILPHPEPMPLDWCAAVSRWVARSNPTVVSAESASPRAGSRSFRIESLVDRKRGLPPPTSNVGGGSRSSEGFSMSLGDHASMYTSWKHAGPGPTALYAVTLVDAYAPVYGTAKSWVVAAGTHT
jgi:hypothetical protein